MAKIPSDIQEKLKALSEKVDVPVNSLLKRMKEIIEENEEIKAMGDSDKEKEFKIRIAWSSLYREHAMTGNAEDFLVQPIHEPRAREVKIKGEPTWVGDLSALVQKISKDDSGNTVKGDVTYASGTFWREGAKRLNRLEAGKVYKAQLIPKENKWGLEISSDRTSFTSVNDKMPDFKEFFKENIEARNLLINLSEMDMFKSEDTTDIKILYATVIDCDVGEKDGREYGWYSIMDDSIMGSNHRLFVNPKDVKWSQGSLLYFGGTIRVDEKGDVSWNNQFIYPSEIAMPKQFEIKPVEEGAPEKETVDINLDESEEEKGEEAKETKEGEKDGKMQDFDI